jgi:hypothetical protein
MFSIVIDNFHTLFYKTALVVARLSNYKVPQIFCLTIWT